MRVRSAGGLLALVLAALALATLAASCSLSTEEASSSTSSGSGEERRITLVHTSWEESRALALLTQVVLEDELGYEASSELAASEEDAFERVSSGEADVFQGIWRPRHNALISTREGEIDMLGQWLFGTTRASLAAPSYMEIRRVSDLENTDATEALTLAPDASGVGEIPAEVFERHGLEPSVYDGSSGMMEEVQRLYEREEEFVFLAYSPHWMNLEYAFDYLEGGELLEDINRPSTLHSAARTGLSEADPLAHALFAEASLTEYQIESLQLAIRDAENPSEGAREWVESNEGLVGSWVYLARQNVS